MSVSSRPTRLPPIGVFRSAGRVVLKAFLLFLAFNVLYALIGPLPLLGRISAYNLLIPGRLRLPYGENPRLSYNLSPFDLNSMFASHELAAGQKPESEYRVLLIGDSSVWGFLLGPQQTTAAFLNQPQLSTGDGRKTRAYNLGYPVMSLMKDVLILHRALSYDPDLVLWLVTLESFPLAKQFSSPLVQNNARLVRTLIEDYQLGLDTGDPNLVNPSLWDRTIVGQRRALADLLRLQLYGVMWAATGIDFDFSQEFEPRAEDLSSEITYQGIQPPQHVEDILAPEVLQGALRMAGDVPVVIVNQPMFRSQGENSDLRYNFQYPRWAYDEYRDWLRETCDENGWTCWDLWDAIAGEEFTNTAFHLTPAGSAQLAGLLGDIVLQAASAPNPP